MNQKANKQSSGCPHAGGIVSGHEPRTEHLVIPFPPLPPYSESVKEAIKAEAAKANDRYLREFLEDHSFCPFARAGRLDGSSARRIIYFDDPDPEALIELMVEVAQDKKRAVTQVIFPLIQVAPHEWREFCLALTDHGHARLGGSKELAVAPLHPQLPYTEESPSTLVTLFRRSPDPTIQWVRLDALAEIYKGRSGERRFVPPEEIAAYLSQPHEEKNLYDRIAETNRQMAERLGLPKVEAMLSEYHQDAQAAYARIIKEN